MIPPSTMKDDYRWYNSKLFEQRDEFIKRMPELKPQIYNNKSLKPVLNQPEHLVQQEKVRGGALKTNDDGSMGNVGVTDGPNGTRGVAELSPEPKMYVCCPQEDNLMRHGDIAVGPPAGYSNEEAVNAINGPRNGRFGLKLKRRTTFRSTEDGFYTDIKEDTACTQETEKVSLTNL